MRRNQNKSHYSWKFWVMVIVVITVVTVAILLTLLSINAVVQNVQLIYYKNKVEGTVTLAEYEGGKTVEDSSAALKYDHVHFIITFDDETAGHSQYEYHADNIISTKKYEGERYIVLFNDLKKPRLIRKGDIEQYNAILLLFIVLVAIVVIFRKKLWLWIKKLGKQLDKQIDYSE